MFEKRHYEATAELLGRLRPDPTEREAHEQWEAIVREFCKMMLLDNPAFSLPQFLSAVKSQKK